MSKWVTLGYRVVVGICVVWVLLAALLPVFVDRRAHIDASVRYARNPTPENRATLDNERRITEQEELVTKVTEAAPAVVVLVLVVYFRRRALRSLQDHQNSEAPTAG